MDMSIPSGHFRFLILFLPADELTKDYSVGSTTRVHMFFLWCVSVVIVLPTARSHKHTTVSILPVITCGLLY